MPFTRIQKWRTMKFDQSEEIADELKGWHLSNTEVLKHPSINGVCYSLSVDWIKRKLSQAEKGMARVQNLDVGKAISRQGLYTNVLKGGGSQDSQYEPAERALGIKPGDYKTMNSPLWSGSDWYSDRIAVNFRGGAGKAFLMGYYFHRLDGTTWKAGGGGHAVAWYLSHGNLHMGSIFGGRHAYLFDPNCGEFRMNEGELTTFIHDYFSDVRDAFAPNLFPMTYFVRTYENTQSATQKVEKNVVSGLQKQLEDKMKRGGA